MNTKYRVDIIESERGWGQRLDAVRYFDSFEEANNFSIEYNAANTLPQVPDWYMYARSPYLVDLDER